MYTIDQAPKDLTPPFEHTEPIVVYMSVHISNKGKMNHILSVPVWGWKSLYDGETYINGNTTAYLDRIKKEEMSK